MGSVQIGTVCAKHPGLGGERYADGCCAECSREATRRARQRAGAAWAVRVNSPAAIAKRTAAQQATYRARQRAIADATRAALRANRGGARR